MSTLEYILVFTFIGSIGSLSGGLILLTRKGAVAKLSHYLTAFAAGVLLGVAFLDLLPEALHEGEAFGLEQEIFLYALGGLLLFFFAEHLIHFFHRHEEQYHEHEKESASTIPLIIVGDTMHNFVDGVVIAATFMIDIPLGIATTLAVAAHEVPQEIGDFALLLHKGMSRMKVVVVNILSASAAFAGAIVTYLLGNVLESYIPLFLAVTAGFFIYIATSDLIPEIHYERNKKAALIKSGLLFLGVIVLSIAVTFIEEGA